MTEAEAYVAFSLTDRVGIVRLTELVERAGDVVSAWQAYPEKTSRTGGEVDWRAELNKARRYGVSIVTPADAGYPAMLRNAPGRPLALYVKGEARALSLPSVALVGTRRATEYGLAQAHRFGKELGEAGWCVVSGLALGIDAEAHRGALAAGAPSVGVIGSGLDQFYPEENRELAHEIIRHGGAVVSQFPFGRPPDVTTFPIRNHVVAALVRGVVAIECPVKSGTLITTGIAADLGRTVMAVPSRVDSRAGAGCLKLIREGATLVRSARDVGEALGALSPVRPRRRAAAPGEKGKAPEAAPPPPPAPPPLPRFSVDEARVMRFVDEAGVSLDELSRQTGYSIEKLNVLTMTLRLKGRLRFLPGNRVALPRAE